MASDRIIAPNSRSIRDGVTRRTLLAAAAGVSAAAMLPAAARAEFPIPDVPPLEKEDYGEARKRFHTNLLRKGPSPEQSAPLGTPAGARRVMYRGGPDGSIELIAWISSYEPSAKLKPAVLFLHGGNATGDGHWELMKAYWEAGYVVMLPSFRGENGQAGNYSGFYDETSDALAAASYLEDLPGIDKNRFFLAGHSNGGTLALLASMTRKFRASAPISAGVNSWRYFGRFEREVRFDENDQQEFVMRSSVCFGHSLKCPTLLLRGTEERPFDADHQLLMDRAKSTGVSIEAKLLPGNHNGVVPGAVAESIRFFNQVIG
ncbi:prolyl oligopeptidase family serine peptidase [Neorhizobium sp. BETTINA12A]|uniref:alpha/beta hydrolase family protein n=1 Tax=Neorhizobium sp. BETTINA12A TaxID=2908924 RepID=UPI001FF4B427|nr:alpha/beta fold hydrolase [Neorhizobium sp. BETTINA12A]MCJ9752828.1 prolyl oligopeptidase family serine peptidase [Neorhizobium sp. BETTINA12A]